jgi:hypothetical protein
VTSLVEQFASQNGWEIARRNVIVEGDSDVALLHCAAELHLKATGRAIIDDDFSIISAGHGDDGGVEGVNRGLVAFRQMAEADRDEAGALRHRFIGLFDNDHAGRTAFNLAPRFCRRIVPCVDIFLLQPVMPPVTNGILDPQIEATRCNLPYSGMDWEIEDLCSDRLLNKFEMQNPRAVLKRVTKNNRTHREFSRSSKSKITRFFINEAKFEDALQLLNLLKSLRSYLSAENDFIVTNA